MTNPKKLNKVAGKLIAALEGLSHSDQQSVIASVSAIIGLKPTSRSHVDSQSRRHPAKKAKLTAKKKK